MVSARAYASMPFPGSYLATKLDTYTAPVRMAYAPFNRHHFYKGTGTFEAFCSLDRLNSCRHDSAPRQLMTGGLFAVGAVAQATVWTLAGVGAALVSAALCLTASDFTTRMYMADHYLPLMFSIMLLNTALYLAALAGCVVLARACFV